MARYLIGTALTNKGTVRKQQPSDKFRKLLIRQKIPFTERGLDPMVDNIDVELTDGAWEARGYMFMGRFNSYRKNTQIQQWPAIEFTFDDVCVLS